MGFRFLPKSITPAFVPRQGVRHDTGIATLYNDKLAVHAPAGPVRARVVDPAKETGFTHSYLRPYEAFVRGIWSKRRDNVVPFNLRISVSYVLLEVPSPVGLVCAGAISLARASRGYTFSFFPCLPRRNMEEPEVDHLSAHMTFMDGNVSIGSIHGKTRLAGDQYPTTEVPLDNARSDNYHFAFEYWFRDVVYLDVAGLVTAGDGHSFATPSELRRALTCTGNCQPNTLGCSSPSRTGIFLPGYPGFVRVGILTERGRAVRGGTANALSSPIASDKSETYTRVHRVKDLSKYDRDWPSGVSMFIELGRLKKRRRSAYSLPDLKATRFDQTTGP